MVQNYGNYLPYEIPSQNILCNVRIVDFSAMHEMRILALTRIEYKCCLC